VDPRSSEGASAGGLKYRVLERGVALSDGAIRKETKLERARRRLCMTGTQIVAEDAPNNKI